MSQILSILTSIISQLAQGTPFYKISTPALLHTDASGLEILERVLFSNKLAIALLEDIESLQDPAERIARVLRCFLDLHIDYPNSGPLNPIHGEYLKTTSGDFCFQAVQKEHHPPITDFRITGKSFIITTNGFTVDGFKSVSIGLNNLQVQFPTIVYFDSLSQHLEWNFIGYKVSNLIGSKRNVCQIGPISVKDKSGCSFVGNLSENGVLEGEFLDKDGSNLFSVFGNVAKGVDRSDTGSTWFLPPSYEPMNSQIDPRDLEDPLFSKKVWKHVVEAMNKNDFNMADKEKHVIEQLERDKRKQGIPVQIKQLK
ncbi:hypothetical protein EDD86DRAFT_205470 [Gorgonomyces haynaldii]|nr:hypothetical protein EDD86DRAFT_205470 [Gorgonomyces haynaldii]